MPFSSPLRRLFQWSMASLAALALVAPAAQAQQWPGSRDRIQFVVPFNTGGSADRLARGLAQFLPKELNDVPITVVNRPGASGALGAAFFKAQPDDGSVFLVMQATPFLANAILQTDIPVKWEDLEVINTQWIDYAIVAVPKDSPFQTFEDLIEKLRSGPGAASTGAMVGSGAYLQQLGMLELLNIPRENVRFVTYDGGGPLRTAIAGGHLDFTFAAAQGSEVIRDRIRSLAIVNDREVEEWEGPLFNDVLKEKYGVTMPLFSSYTTSLIAHATFKQKHPERYETLVAAYERALQRDDYREWLKQNQIGGLWLGPEESRKLTTEGYEGLAKYSHLAKN
ncbi:MAG: tripartite tricarboxylate transporter substrate-binding protein [Alphaproteobacteria bacterium]